MEGDSLRSILERRQKNFNPLPPHGGRLVFFNVFRWILHFNPLPPHGGRPYIFISRHDRNFISIHSLRMEGDQPYGAEIITEEYFNPLPPHGGRRFRNRNFLPRTNHFNPLPPHGGRRKCMELYHRTACISIHSLRMEGDGISLSSMPI